MIYSWTMRHEAKLTVIKRASRRGNFKNICWTIARHSQRALCYDLNCYESFLTKGIDIASTFTERPLFNESEEIRRHIDGLRLVVHSVRHLGWIKCDVPYLKRHSYIYLGNGEMYPKFGKSFDILAFITDLYTGDSVYYCILVQMCDTILIHISMLT